MALTIIISAARSYGSGAGWGFLSFIATACAIAFQAWQQIETYPQRKRDHQREAGAYPKKLEDYDRKKRQHEEENRASRNPERVSEFQYKLLRDILSWTSRHDGDRSVAKRGRSEANFGDYLKRYFPGKIHSGLTLKIWNFDHPYTADFTYVDSSLKLHIDVEVDEPYAYNTKEPTHYLGARKDDNRNDFFLGKGWLVIRFSEEQASCYPQSCCKTITSASAQVLGDDSVLNQFATVPNLQLMRQWTQSEAEDMDANNYRDKYLQQPSELADSSIEVEPQVSRISLPNNSRAQSRGAARAARRAALSTSSPKSNYINEQVAIIKTGKKAHSSLLDKIFTAAREGDKEKMEEALLVLERVEKPGLNNVVYPGYTMKIRNRAEQEFNNKTV